MSSANLDLRRRADRFAALERTVFDVLIVGGGITGAGVARDAAMRGLDVALVDAADFASGTSSRSSKMIHGGLRYLQMGDIALVREAASERKIVQVIAPHLAHETPFVIPAKTSAAIATLRAGLWTFEKLGGVPKSRAHEVWSPAKLRQREPTIAADDLAGAVVYPEYLTDDARLTLANVRSAAAHGATVLNYAAVDNLLIEDGRAVGAVVRDALDEAHGARVRSRLIVNATGPWVDAVRALEAPGVAPKLKLSKGIHLVVDRQQLPVNHTVIMPAADRRSVFAAPKGRATYLGTTDTFHSTADYWPVITPADADYLLDAAAKRFSTPRLTHEHITSAWSGVRPLVGEEGKSASEISRKDEIWTGPAGMLSIAGGKLTAYRRMAERVVDRIEEALGRRPSASRTAIEPLAGGDVDVAAARADLERGGMAPKDADRLVALYGAEAADLADAGGDVAAEARHAVLAEGALMLEDYWVRRSARAWFGEDGGLGALQAAAGTMAPLLGWSLDVQRAQIEACQTIHAASLAGLRRQTVGGEVA